jgi:hypothetical protein
MRLDMGSRARRVLDNYVSNASKPDPVDAYLAKLRQLAL